jgi:hypothetical protein
MFGVVFTVTISSIMAKPITVAVAFKVTSPGRRERWLLVPGASHFIPIYSLIQLILCGIWLETYPPFIDTNMHSEHDYIIIICNKGSVVSFYCVLGFLVFLALGSLLLLSWPGTSLTHSVKPSS